MAQDKKSFLFYVNWKKIFEPLPNELRGELLMHILRYVNDENPTTDNFIIESLFSSIQDTLKRDLKKWDAQREQRNEASKKGVEARKKNAELRRLQREQNSFENSDLENATRNYNDSQEVDTVNQAGENDNRAVNRAVTSGTQSVTRNQPVNSNMLIVSTNVDVKKGKNVVDDSSLFSGSYEEIKSKQDGSYYETDEYRQEIEKNIATLKTYGKWKEDIARSCNLESIAEVDAWLDRYQIRILEVRKPDVSVKELRLHFVNWVRKVKPMGTVVVQRDLTVREKNELRSKRFMTN